MSQPLPQAFDSVTVDDHRLTVIVDAEARLSRLLALIEGAQESLRLCYYIFADDAVGTTIRESLIDACNRGVAVTLLLDGFGSALLSESFLDPLQEAGARIDRFLPRMGRRYLLRNHQKILIADGKRALVGGANIAEDYFRPTDSPPWHDLSLLIEGQKAADLTIYVDALQVWMRSHKQSIRRLQGLIAAGSDHTGVLQWKLGGPFERLSPYARALRADLDAAKTVDMIQAYFAPEFTFLRRLGRAARRGEARLMTAALSDNTTTIGAARHCYGLLLRRDTKIYEYRAAKLHMKLIVADDVTYIGSANYDARSIFINLEIMLRIADAKFAKQMRDFCQTEMAGAQEITPDWLKRASGPFRRLRWFLAWFLFSTIDYTIARRFNIGPDRRQWRLRPARPPES